MIIEPNHLVDVVDRAIQGNSHAIKAWGHIRKAILVGRDMTMDEAGEFYEAYGDAATLPKVKMTAMDDDLVVNLSEVI
jgi:hypothetical protein